jgi:pimeloyl-ACP methyl ester carboxylesterase
MIRAVFALTFILAACSKGGSSDAGPSTPPGYTKADYDKYCPRLTLPSGQTIKYCTRSPSQVYSNTDIVYFFHGAGGDGTDIDFEPFNTWYGQATAMFGSRTPWVVAIDYGPLATIDLTGSQLDDLQNFVFPQIETQLGYRPGFPPVRHLIGMSLGGFNALHVAAGRPQLFKSIAALCPALYTFDPFNANDMQNFIDANAATVNPGLVRETVGQLIQRYGTEDVWAANNPFLLAQAGDFDSLNIFISTGQQDEFGFFPGSQLLVQTLTQRGKSPTWMPVNGGHCSFDTWDLLSFLSNNISTP